jgi:hypothetical protein
LALSLMLGAVALPALDLDACAESLRSIPPV